MFGIRDLAHTSRANAPNTLYGPTGSLPRCLDSSAQSAIPAEVTRQICHRLRIEGLLNDLRGPQMRSRCRTVRPEATFPVLTVVLGSTSTTSQGSSATGLCSTP